MIYSRSGVAIRACVGLLGGLLVGGQMRAQTAPTSPSPEQQKGEHEYAEMLARVQRGDMTVDFRAFRAAGALRSGPHASNLELAEGNAFRNIAASGDWTGAFASAKRALDRNYASPIAHYDAMIACQKLQQKGEAATHEKILNALLDSIRQSGDGKSPETAYFVVTGQEEYIFLGRVLHLQGRSQSLARKEGHFYDRLLVLDPATNKTQDLWFNADFDFSEQLANVALKDGTLSTATVIPPNAAPETPRQESSLGSAQTAQPNDRLESTSVGPPTSLDTTSADGEPVIRWGNFHLVQGPGPWSVTYSVSGTYKLRAHSVTITIQSGSARISEFRPAGEINRLVSLQLGACYSIPGGGGNWGIYPPSGPQSVNIPLDNVVLKKGETYSFPLIRVKVPLPEEPLPPENWLCSSLKGQVGGNPPTGSYPAHDESRPLVLSGQNNTAAQPTDRLDSTSIALAGPGAVDCGRVRLRGDPKVATDCALNAFSHKTPFRVRYDLQGIDSFPALGIVGTPDAKLYELHFDSDAMGRGRQFGAQTLQTLPCPDPPALVPSDNRLTCFPHGIPLKSSPSPTAGGAYVPTVFVGMYAPLGDASRHCVHGQD